MSETARQLELPLAVEHRTVLVPGRWFAVLAIDLEQRADGWWSSCACLADPGLVEPWRGPYPGRPSAERNAAAFGRRGLLFRGQAKLAALLATEFQLPNV